MKHKFSHAIATFISWLKEPKTTLELLGMALLVSAAIVFGHWFHEELSSLESWLKSLGSWAPFIFFGLYILLTSIPLTASLLGVVAGFSFPFWEALGVLCISKVVAACVWFKFARYAQKKIKLDYLSKNPKFKGIDKLLEKDGLKILFLIRLCPINFSLLNYFLGCTKVKFIDYFLSLSATLYGSIISVYYGNMAYKLAKVSGTSTSDTRIYDIVFALSIVITFIAISFITRTVRRSLKQYTEGTAIEKLY